MSLKFGLIKCNDFQIPKLSHLFKKGKIKAQEEIVLPNGKAYYVTATEVHSNTNNIRGNVRKTYFKCGDDWFLEERQVKNERGSYRRGMGGLVGANDTDEFVSLGGQEAFIRQANGNYVQSALGSYPERIVTSEEIEAAIDYIKGRGSAENYKRLLR